MATNEKIMTISPGGRRVIAPEKKDFVSFERYHAKELREEWLKLGERINELYSEEAELLKEKTEEAEEKQLLIDNEIIDLFAEQGRIRQEMLDKYTDMFCKEPREILTVIEKDLLPYVSLEAYKSSLLNKIQRFEYFDKNRNVYTDITQEVIKSFEEESIENYSNFINYIRSIYHAEVSVAEFYGLNKDLEKILKKFASQFYQPPKEYTPLLNQPGTNALNRITGKRFELDEEGHGRGIVGGLLEVHNSRGNVPEPSSYPYVRTYCFEMLTEQLNYRREYEASILSKREVELDVDGYMERRGLKDRKQGVKQMVESLNYMFDLSLKTIERTTWDYKTGKRKKPELTTWRFRLIDGFQDDGEKAVVKKGKIKVRFNVDLLFYLAYGYITQMPQVAYTINARKYPYAFKFLYKLADHKNQNVGRKSEKIIGVKTLLKEAPELPTYEEVMKGNRNVTDRIIKPFEDSMNALQEEYGIITWEYCNKKGEPLTEEQLTVFSYKEWEAFYIKYEMTDYPRIDERRAERKAIQEARKEGKLQAIKKQAKREMEKKVKDS